MMFKPLRPVKIDQIATHQVQIVWDDGHRSLHTYRLLRLACGCAFCRDEQTGRLLIKLDSIPEDIHPRDITTVGNYALRFHWSDNHATGFYPYAHLRKICECPECLSHRERAEHPAQPADETR